jgi:hypothetical protein
MVVCILVSDLPLVFFTRESKNSNLREGASPSNLTCSLDVVEDEYHDLGVYFIMVSLYPIEFSKEKCNNDK